MKKFVLFAAFAWAVTLLVAACTAAPGPAPAPAPVPPTPAPTATPAPGCVVGPPCFVTDAPTPSGSKDNLVTYRVGWPTTGPRPGPQNGVVTMEVNLQGASIVENRHGLKEGLAWAEIFFTNEEVRKTFSLRPGESYHLAPGQALYSLFIQRGASVLVRQHDSSEGWVYEFDPQ